jgi:outer membrane protein LpxR
VPDGICKLVTLLVFIQLGAGGVRSTHAQQTTRMTTFATGVVLQFDNDFLAVRGAGPPPDYDYTHGSRLGITWPGANGLGRRLGGPPDCRSARSESTACLLTGFAIAQEIYTPRHNTIEPVSGDRPYAAWSYASMRLMVLRPRSLTSMAVNAGVTGPPALGEEVQNGIHRVLHNARELGWSHQVPAQFGATLDVDYTRVVFTSSGAVRAPAPSRFVAATLGSSLGNIQRNLRLGGIAYWSFGHVFTPIASEPLVRHPGRFFVATRVYYLSPRHDEFIEGGGGSPGAQLRHGVDEVTASAGWRARGVALEYGYTSRGREYRAQPGRHAYGSLVATLVVP